LVQAPESLWAQVQVLSLAQVQDSALVPLRAQD
jgi:hypothetical protein